METFQNDGTWQEYPISYRGLKIYHRENVTGAELVLVDAKSGEIIRSESGIRAVKEKVRHIISLYLYGDTGRKVLP
jgi:hypothetical protein